MKDPRKPSDQFGAVKGLLIACVAAAPIWIALFRAFGA